MINNKRILRTGALAAAMTIVFAIFAFRAAEWTKGLDSEFLVYGAASGGSTGTGGTTGGATTKVIAQIAAGFYGDVEPKAYGTVIEIVNPNSTAVTVSGNFYNAEYPDPTKNGTPSTLKYGTNLSSPPAATGISSDGFFTGSFSNVALPAYSILVIRVGTGPDTMPATGTTNWGQISASNTISVGSFFELRHSANHVLYSRVGIPASRADMSSFVIPRVREKQLTGSGLSDIETGFALVNTGSKAASVSAKVYDVNGNVVGSGSLLLAPNAHKAVFVNDSGTFNFLSPEPTGRQYHYILLSSDQPTIGAASLAFEGGSLTSFPVDALQ